MTDSNNDKPHANQQKPQAPSTVDYVKKSREPATNAQVPEKKES